VLSQALAKQAIDQGLSTSLADGLRIERDAFVESFRTNDSQIGVSSFLEHGPGKAQFTGT
jgi:enoyl-CoA hydratase